MLLFLFQLLRIYLTPLNLSGDEAHYWQWSQVLDYSYYSKGPAIALLIHASNVLFEWGLGARDTAMAVRFPALFCAALFSIVLYALLREVCARPIDALLGWCAVQSMLMFQQMAFLMTTDAPAAFCWLVATSSAYLALCRDKSAYWLLCGLFVGLGFWAKYTLVFLPASIFLFLLIQPAYRRHIRGSFFWVGALIAGLVPCAHSLLECSAWLGEFCSQLQSRGSQELDLASRGHSI